MSFNLRRILQMLNTVFVLTLIAGAVSLAQSVKSSYLPGIDFSKYKTYQWVTIRDRQHPDAAIDAEIERSIDSQLATKGLSRADTSADLTIDYQVAVSKTEKWVNYEDRGGSWNDFGVTSAPTKAIIRVGSIVLDIYDTSGRRLIWTGTVAKALNTGGTWASRKNGLDRAITELLRDFPPK